jgi:hypothetical protein
MDAAAGSRTPVLMVKALQHGGIAMTEPRKQELKDAAHKAKRGDRRMDPVEEASIDSFPASDPPAHTRSERERKSEEQKRKG